MKVLKRMSTVTLALLMLSGTMAGCSKNSEDSTASTSADSVTTAAPAEPVPLKIFANFTSATETTVDKAWQAKVEKALNITLDWEIPPSTGYADRLQVMLAGGAYPDVIFFADATAKVFTDSVTNGVIVPITEYIADSENIQKYSYDFSLEALKAKGDDDIYGIPRTTVQRGDGFFIRKDWVDNVGFTIPSDNLITIEQFEELMTKFTKNDPDKNGKDDTYGWAGSADGNGNMNPIMDYPFGSIGWQKATSGDYEYIDTQHNQDTTTYKNILQFSQDLFTNGFIDPNAPSLKSDAALQRFYQGVTGAIDGFSGWTATYVTNITKVNPNAKITYISGIKNAEGEFKKTAYGTGLWGLWGVTSACKNPDTAVKFFDYLLSDDGWTDAKYGPEGVGYTVSNGEKIPTADYAEFSINGWSRNFVRRNNDPSFFVALDTPAEYKESVTNWIDIAIKGKVQSLDFGYRPVAADNPELIDYNTKLGQNIAKIITGALPVDSWDDTLSGWYEAGGKEYVTQMNEQIKKTQGK